MLPSDAKARKDIPIFTGFVKYFPDAIAAVAQLSFIANEQHNPGEPLHWSKDKSSDHLDAQMRHIVDSTETDRDADGILHLTKNAWRALAELQTLADDGVNIFAMLPAEKTTPARQWVAQFAVRRASDLLVKVETRGPFDTWGDAYQYATKNPENIAGVKTIHELFNSK